MAAQYDTTHIGSRSSGNEGWITDLSPSQNAPLAQLRRDKAVQNRGTGLEAKSVGNSSKGDFLENLILVANALFSNTVCRFRSSNSATERWPEGAMENGAGTDNTSWSLSSEGTQRSNMV